MQDDASFPVDFVWLRHFRVFRIRPNITGNKTSRQLPQTKCEITGIDEHSTFVRKHWGPSMVSSTHSNLHNHCDIRRLQEFFQGGSRVKSSKNYLNRAIYTNFLQKEGVQILPLDTPGFLGFLQKMQPADSLQFRFPWNQIQDLLLRAKTRGRGKAEID